MTDRELRRSGSEPARQKSVAILLREMRLSAERVRELEREYKIARMRAMRQRDEALSRAAAMGVPLSELAEAALLSKVRVKQILEEDKWR